MEELRDKLPQNGEVWMKLECSNRWCKLGSLGPGVFKVDTDIMPYWGTHENIHCGCLIKISEYDKPFEIEFPSFPWIPPIQFHYYSY